MDAGTFYARVLRHFAERKLTTESWPKRTTESNVQHLNPTVVEKVLNIWLLGLKNVDAVDLATIYQQDSQLGVATFHSPSSTVVVPDVGHNTRFATRFATQSKLQRQVMLSMTLLTKKRIN